MPSLDLKKTGKTFWRSLDELADTEEFREFMASEFAGYSVSEMMLGSSSRRQFLKIMGASLALGGLVGCRRWPKRTLAPYSERPDGRVPGVTEQYASIMEVVGTGKPVMVTAFDGRPIKIEGNPEHPASGGAADTYMQASVLDLYDPERSRSVMERTESEQHVRTWEQFDTFADAHFANLKSSRGRGLAVLSEAVGSPTMRRLRDAFMRTYPQATWHEYESVSFDVETAGTRRAFGRPLRPIIHLDEADVIVSFDADLLGEHPDALRHARDWAAKRRTADEGAMSRMYVAESRLSTTGARADERFAARPSRIEALARAIHALAMDETPTVDAEILPHAEAVIAELEAHRGHVVLAAGPTQPASVHAICHALNSRYGAVGRTVTYIEVDDRPSHVEALAELTTELNAGDVETLVIVGGNPVYDAPVDLEFGAAMAKAPVSIHLSMETNETARASRWSLPRAHYLEAWGDAASWDGTIGLAQPLIEPLYEGRSAIEIVAQIIDGRRTPGYDLVRETMLPLVGGEQGWRRAVHDGHVAAGAPRRVTPGMPDVLNLGAPTATAEMEAVFVADACVYDGRFANNGWLQELPDPMTTVTWDNAAVLSPATAKRLRVEDGDMVGVEIDGREVEIAAFVLPGAAADVVVLPLGYGRTASGHVGQDVGVNVNAIRTTGAFGAAPAKVRKLTRTYDLVTTQNHHTISGELLQQQYKQRVDSLIREADLEHYREHPKFATEHSHGDVGLQLFEEPIKYDEGHRWGMTIDLNSCIGCNACVVACQAENNIPIVGKEQVARGREMHWIRLDRYFKGEPDEAQVTHQPITCHHCENAPCEQVCPVAATVHDSEGLNVMVYNRCIGTRYCANNCPYKVRRFNYFDWHTRDPRMEGNDTQPHLAMPDTRTRDEVDSIRRMQHNPDVTVRMRGVMEKCTFCTQRIQSAKIHAKNEYAKGRRESHRVQDGEVTSACAQTCPTQAIVFGDLNDPNSRVHKLFEHNRAYGLLSELNVRPRLKYLAKVRNPKSGGTHASAGHETTEAPSRS
jgi:MoCo/4Fe-4S cofactor protein with predicted Tat translocation signal